MATEKRLIFADDLKRAIRDDPHIDGRNFDMIKNHINEAKTVDAVEVVHGRWLISHTVAFSEECSQCGFCVPWDDYGMLHKYNYCPNCGAKMDGDGNG